MARIKIVLRYVFLMLILGETLINLSYLILSNIHYMCVRGEDGEGVSEQHITCILATFHMSCKTRKSSVINSKCMD